MKKWLDDLYAILLNRGFATLDNSLKNYDSFDKRISKEVQSGPLQSHSSFNYDLSTYNCNSNDIFIFKCVFSNGKVAIVDFIRISTNYNLRLTTIGISPDISVTFSSNVVTVYNNSDNDLTYSLSINIV